MIKSIVTSGCCALLLISLLSLGSCTPSPKYHSGKIKKSEKKRPRKSKQLPVPYSTRQLQAPVRNFHSSLIESNFGIRRHPRYHTQEFHRGIDIKADLGDEVVAAGNGKIIFAGRQRGYGKVVIIDHGSELCTVYAHLSSILPKKGDTVIAGQLIGQVGLTGNSTGPHLHFEVREDGKAVDPLDYMIK